MLRSSIGRGRSRHAASFNHLDTRHRPALHPVASHKATDASLLPIPFPSMSPSSSTTPMTHCTLPSRLPAVRHSHSRDLRKLPNMVGTPCHPPACHPSPTTQNTARKTRPSSRVVVRSSWPCFCNPIPTIPHDQIGLVGMGTLALIWDSGLQGVMCLPRAQKPSEPFSRGSEPFSRELRFVAGRDLQDGHRQDKGVDPFRGNGLEQMDCCLCRRGCWEEWHSVLMGNNTTT